MRQILNFGQNREPHFPTLHKKHKPKRKDLAMNKKFIYPSSFAVSALLSLMPQAPSQAATSGDTPTCAEMGYTSNSLDCINSGGTPLMCPYSGESAHDCICVTKSCRGYPLYKEDDGSYTYLTEDGGKVKAQPVTGTIEDNTENLDSCTTGYGNDAKTYYRVSKCKEGFLYQNNICDEGCDTANKYPFDTHPGNLAGTVEICKDASGNHYGYTSCNDGWLFSNGKCNLNTCDIKEYPYMSDPNFEEDRGETKTCKIGGNAYYRYTSCKDGFELKKGVCVGTCEITNCSSTDKSVTGNGTTRNYKDWSCTLNNSKCRIGDTAVLNDVKVGTVFHLPDGTNDKTLVMSLTTTSSMMWAKGIAQTTDVSGLSNFTSTATAITDMDGKKNTNLVLAFRDSKGWTKGGANSYPAAEYCMEQSISSCTSGTMCAIGEWYLPSEGELGYMYDNRYLLYNVTGSTTFYSNYFWSSTEYNADGAWGVYFSSGVRDAGYKGYSWVYVRPVLAF